MSALPQGWAQAKLGEVADTRLGKMLSAKSRTGVGSHPYLRNKNVQWARFDLDEVREMDFSADELERFEVVPGDLLVCEGGEVGRAAVWRGRIARVGFQKALHRVRPYGEVAPEFLLYLFMRLAQTNGFDAFVTGSTIKHLPQEDLRELPVPLPPLDEQRRIVAAIEEQFSRLDAAETLLTRVRSRLRTLRSLILRGAFDQPWPVSRIDDVANVGSGATPKRGKPEYWLDGTVPWVTSGQLTEPFVREPAALITERALRETNVKLWPKHTLLVALYGEGRTRGHCSELLIESTTNQACAAIVLHDESVSRDYLKLFFAASYEANRELATGGVQPNLSLGLIKNMRFPHPPLDEQQVIARQVEFGLSLMQTLDETLQMASRRGAALRCGILERAFRGELVPQDPNDEPASVLLERIAAERAMAPKTTRRRPRRRATITGS